MPSPTIFFFSPLVLLCDQIDSDVLLCERTQKICELENQNGPWQYFVFFSTRRKNSSFRCFFPSQNFSQQAIRKATFKVIA